jgi:hypothetical protein
VWRANTAARPFVGVTLQLDAEYDYVVAEA